MNMDEADRSVLFDEMYQKELDNKIRKAAIIPKGTPGECEYCGEYFERLINNACGRCRDLYRLK